MRVFLCGLAVLLATPSFAQINTERLRKQIDPGVYLQLDASGGFASGNTDYVQIGVGSRVDLVRGGGDSAFGVARYTLFVVDDVEDVSNAFAHVRYNRPLVKSVVGEAFAQVERNAQTLLGERVLLGGGVRFELLERESIGLAVGTTPMFEYESLQPAAMEDDSYALRLSNYASVRVDVSETAEAFGVVYVQPRAGTWDDLRVLHESRLDLRMTKAIKVRLRAALRYDSQPPIGVEDTDLMVTTGFVFTSAGE